MRHWSFCGISFKKRKMKTKEKVGHQQQEAWQRSLVGGASVLLDGNQAKRANFFKVSSSGSGVGPHSAKPGRFSFNEPVFFSYRCCGRYRRWFNATLEWTFWSWNGGELGGCPWKSLPVLFTR